MKKLTLPQSDERLIYLAATALVPGIPLFYLYNHNAAQALLFRHFIITAGVLAVISLAIYLTIAKFILGYSRATIILTLFWAAFWFFAPIRRIIPGGNVSDIFYLLLSIGIIGYFLDAIEINRLVANTIAVLLCVLFAFNFVPGALSVSTSKMRGAYNKATGKLPYEVKTNFRIDRNLPKPNIYWLHMDGMVGFDAVERYFNDPQTALKNDLAERGFVINKSARLEGGGTNYALLAMLSPLFYDSFYAGLFARAAELKLVRMPRENYFHRSMAEKGLSLDDIYPQTEIFKAFSDAGYINVSSDEYPIKNSKNLDVLIDYYNNSIGYFNIYRESNNTFNMLVEFKELITSASVLSIIKPKIDEMFERKRPIFSTQSLPAYQETVDRYVTGSSDSDSAMASVVKATKYVLSIQTPYFVYFMNDMAHCRAIETAIGDIDYGEIIGRTFIYDENGNVYKERLEDPHDVHLYLPQHKYAVKQMMTQVDIIIEDDQNAVIILQGDHGIHGIGTGPDYFDSKFMFERGYNLEDQLNLNLSVISAVRIPPQYGKLSQPLDPLDIARYLVNHFVGKGNYDYLYYIEE
jgi:hypothetical protein